MFAGLSTPAHACTAIYAGSELTETGDTVFGRIEDFSSDYPKLFDVYPAGTHLAGESYEGCYGFSWTFTHDSYSYTGFCEDNSQGVCPDCDGTHEHTPYQSGGTNECGLSVTATETLYENESVTSVDPFIGTGIEEAEITTVLLSEASTAREAMTLLTEIFASAGACSGGSVIVADRNETWYIENLSGTQYIAVELPSNMVMICPNVSVIGSVDLDDTDHVVASDALIETAIQAGSFVGDQEANVIDFAASYDSNGSYSTGSRLAAGLNYLSGSDSFRVDENGQGIERSAYTMTNLDAEGNITELHNSIRTQGPLDLRDVIGYFRTSPIGKPANAETHIFLISTADDTAVGTVEWISMANCRYNVFVPFYPMLTTEVHPSLNTGHMFPEHVQEEPAERTYFPSLSEAGFVIYPEGWEESFYWIFAALNHIVTEDENAAAEITEYRERTQEMVFTEWERVQEEVLHAGDHASEIATQGSIAITEQVCQNMSLLLERFR